jgi:hypothetical protein
MKLMVSTPSPLASLVPRRRLSEISRAHGGRKPPLYCNGFFYSLWEEGNHNRFFFQKQNLIDDWPSLDHRLLA